jgi:putative transposase
VVTPAAKMDVVAHMVSQHDLSERQACRLIGISRTGYRYTRVTKNDKALLGRLLELAVLYPRYGYLMLHGLLKGEELVVNRKRTYRIYTQENLQVRTKKRKKLIRPRVPMSVPTAVNERWSMDFVSDQLGCGRRFRILNIVDDYSREIVGQYVDTSISGHQVARFLDQLAETRSLPKRIVCDNGTEYTSKAMFFWSEETNVKLHFIQPGKPTQNAFVESFNGKFRDNCLNQHWFKSLVGARQEIDSWREHFNTVRPHSSLNYMTPLAYASKAV